MVNATRTVEPRSAEVKGDADCDGSKCVPPPQPASAREIPTLRSFRGNNVRDKSAGLDELAYLDGTFMATRSRAACMKRRSPVIREAMLYVWCSAIG